MKYRFTLYTASVGTVVSNPIGWQDLKIILIRDKTINGLLKQYTTNLTFVKDGYKYIQNYIQTVGYCEPINCLIEEQCQPGDAWSTFFDGYIDLVKEAEYDLQKCQIKVKVQDNGIADKLSKGKTVNISDDSTSVPNLYGYDNYLQMHDDAGVWDGLYGDAFCYDLITVFQRICDHIIGDGLVTVVSDYFTSGTFANIVMTFGGDMNPNVNSDAGLRKIFKPLVNFEQLFVGLDKIFNLSFSIYNSAGIDYIRIEPKTYFRSGSPVLSLMNVANIKYKYDESQLYKTVRVGYSNVHASLFDGNVYDKGIQYNSNTFGCTDNEKDFVSELITDTGICLDEFIDTANIDYMNNIFIIEIEYTDPGHVGNPHFTKKTNVGGHFLYNQNLRYQDNMARQITTLNASTYKSENVNGVINTVTKTNTPLTKLYTFEVPLTRAQFDLFTSPEMQIEFIGKGLSSAASGYVQKAEYLMRTGLTKFEVLGA